MTKRRTTDPSPAQAHDRPWRVTIMRAVNPDGSLIWPEHLSLEQYRSVYHSGGSAKFMAIHMQDSSGLAGDIFNPLHFQDFAHPNYTERQPSEQRPGQWVTLSAKDLLEKGEIQAILPDVRTLTPLQSHDLAISQRETADQYVRCDFYASRAADMYIDDVYADRLTDLEMMKDIATAGRAYRCRAIGIESHAFQSLLLKQARRDYPNLPIIELDPAQRDKVVRARPAADHFERRRVYLRRGARWNQDVRFQLEAFPNGAHDDIPDAIAYAFEMCLKYAPGGWQQLAAAQEDMRSNRDRSISEALS
jgi:predicted phage terminase large subunit-like protein